MAEGYAAVVDAWTGAGKQMIELSDTLASAADAVCRELAEAGACWGDDDIGMAFCNGNGANPGFARSRDMTLAGHADLVNLVRGSGGVMVLSGQRYAATEQANTIGGSPPGGAGAGVASSMTVYRLPPVAAHLVKSDPAPGGVIGFVIRKFEELVGGCTWPNGNTGGLASVQRACAAAAAACDEAARNVDVLTAQVPAAGNKGPATQKFTTSMASLSGSRTGGGVAGLGRQWQALADSAGMLIKQKHAARLQFIVSAGVLAASLAAAMAFGPFTFGGSLAAWAAAAEVEGLLLRAMLLRIAEQVATEAVMGAAFNTAMDLGRQGVNIAYGLRGFSPVELAEAVAEGAIAGGVMGPLQFLADPAIEALESRLSGVLEAGGVSARAAAAAVDAARFTVSSAAGTYGMAMAQGPFGPVNLTEAAEFGVGMAALGAAQEAAVAGGVKGVEALKEPTLSAFGNVRDTINDLGSAVLRAGRGPAASGADGEGAGPGTSDDAAASPPVVPPLPAGRSGPGASTPAPAATTASPAADGTDPGVTGQVPVASTPAPAATTASPAADPGVTGQVPVASTPAPAATTASPAADPGVTGQVPVASTPAPAATTASPAADGTDPGVTGQVPVASTPAPAATTASPAADGTDPGVTGQVPVASTPAPAATTASPAADGTDPGVTGQVPVASTPAPAATTASPAADGTDPGVTGQVPVASTPAPAATTASPAADGTDPGVTGQVPVASTPAPAATTASPAADGTDPGVTGQVPVASTPAPAATTASPAADGTDPGVTGQVPVASTPAPAATTASPAADGTDPGVTGSSPAASNAGPAADGADAGVSVQGRVVSGPAPAASTAGPAADAADAGVSVQGPVQPRPAADAPNGPGGDGAPTGTAGKGDIAGTRPAGTGAPAQPEPATDTPSPPGTQPTGDSVSVGGHPPAADAALPPAEGAAVDDANAAPRPSITDVLNGHASGAAGGSADPGLPRAGVDADVASRALPGADGPRTAGAGARGDQAEPGPASASPTGAAGEQHSDGAFWRIIHGGSGWPHEAHETSGPVPAAHPDPGDPGGAAADLSPRPGPGSGPDIRGDAARVIEPPRDRPVVLAKLDPADLERLGGEYSFRVKDPVLEPQWTHLRESVEPTRVFSSKDSRVEVRKMIFQDPGGAWREVHEYTIVKDIPSDPRLSDDPSRGLGPAQLREIAGREQDALDTFLNYKHVIHGDSRLPDGSLLRDQAQLHVRIQLREVPDGSADAVSRFVRSYAGDAGRPPHRDMLAVDAPRYLRAHERWHDLGGRNVYRDPDIPGRRTAAGPHVDNHYTLGGDSWFRSPDGRAYKEGPNPVPDIRGMGDDDLEHLRRLAAAVDPVIVDPGKAGILADRPAHITSTHPYDDYARYDPPAKENGRWLRRFRRPAEQEPVQQVIEKARRAQETARLRVISRRLSEGPGPDPPAGARDEFSRALLDSSRALLGPSADLNEQALSDLTDLARQLGMRPGGDVPDLTTFMRQTDRAIGSGAEPYHVQGLAAGLRMARDLHIYADDRFPPGPEGAQEVVSRLVGEPVSPDAARRAATFLHELEESGPRTTPSDLKEIYSSAPIGGSREEVIRALASNGAPAEGAAPELAGAGQHHLPPDPQEGRGYPGGDPETGQTDAPTYQVRLGEEVVTIPPGARIWVGREEELRSALVRSGLDNVSRRHVEIYNDPGRGLRITDLGSTNGTFVNDERVYADAPLNVDDVLRLGTGRHAAELQASILEPDVPAPGAGQGTAVHQPPGRPDAQPGPGDEAERAAGAQGPSGSVPDRPGPQDARGGDAQAGTASHPSARPPGPEEGHGARTGTAEPLPPEQLRRIVNEFPLTDLHDDPQVARDLDNVMRLAAGRHPPQRFNDAVDRLEADVLGGDGRSQPGLPELDRDARNIAIHPGRADQTYDDVVRTYRDALEAIQAESARSVLARLGMLDDPARLEARVAAVTDLARIGDRRNPAVAALVSDRAVAEAISDLARTLGPDLPGLTPRELIDLHDRVLQAGNHGLSAGDLPDVLRRLRQPGETAVLHQPDPQPGPDDPGRPQPGPDGEAAHAAVQQDPGPRPDLGSGATPGGDHRPAASQPDAPAFQLRLGENAMVITPGESVTIGRLGVFRSTDRPGGGVSTRWDNVFGRELNGMDGVAPVLHAKISNDPETGLRVTDVAGSGVFVNGRLIEPGQPHDLRPGDVLHLGRGSEAAGLEVSPPPDAPAPGADPHSPGTPPPRPDRAPGARPGPDDHHLGVNPGPGARRSGDVPPGPEEGPGAPRADAAGPLPPERVGDIANALRGNDPAAEHPAPDEGPHLHPDSDWHAALRNQDPGTGPGRLSMDIPISGGEERDLAGSTVSFGADGRLWLRVGDEPVHLNHVLVRAGERMPLHDGDLLESGIQGQMRVDLPRQPDFTSAGQEIADRLDLEMPGHQVQGLAMMRNILARDVARPIDATDYFRLAGRMREVAEDLWSGNFMKESLDWQRTGLTVTRIFNDAVHDGFVPADLYGAEDLTGTLRRYLEHVTARLSEIDHEMGFRDEPLPLRATPGRHAPGQVTFEGHTLNVAPGESITVGRHPDAEFSSEFARSGLKKMSRLHLEISSDPDTGELRVRDLNSTNGTFVNGERIDPGEPPRRLETGDRVTLGADRDAPGLEVSVPQETHALRRLYEVARAADPSPQIGAVDALNLHRLRLADDMGHDLSMHDVAEFHELASDGQKLADSLGLPRLDDREAEGFIRAFDIAARGQVLGIPHDVPEMRGAMRRLLAGTEPGGMDQAERVLYRKLEELAHTIGFRGAPHHPIEEEHVADRARTDEGRDPIAVRGLVRYFNAVRRAGFDIHTAPDTEVLRRELSEHAADDWRLANGSQMAVGVEHDLTDGEKRALGELGWILRSDKTAPLDQVAELTRRLATADQAVTLFPERPETPLTLQETAALYAGFKRADGVDALLQPGSEMAADNDPAWRLESLLGHYRERMFREAGRVVSGQELADLWERVRRHSRIYGDGWLEHHRNSDNIDQLAPKFGDAVVEERPDPGETSFVEVQRRVLSMRDLAEYHSEVAEGNRAAGRELPDDAARGLARMLKAASGREPAAAQAADRHQLAEIARDLGLADEQDVSSRLHLDADSIIRLARYFGYASRDPLFPHDLHGAQALAGALRDSVVRDPDLYHGLKYADDLFETGHLLTERHLRALADIYRIVGGPHSLERFLGAMNESPTWYDPRTRTFAAPGRPMTTMDLVRLVAHGQLEGHIPASVQGPEDLSLQLGDAAGQRVIPDGIPGTEALINAIHVHQARARAPALRHASTTRGLADLYQRIEVAGTDNELSLFPSRPRSLSGYTLADIENHFQRGTHSTQDLDFHWRVAPKVDDGRSFVPAEHLDKVTFHIIETSDWADVPFNIGEPTAAQARPGPLGDDITMAVIRSWAREAEMGRRLGGVIGEVLRENPDGTFGMLMHQVVPLRGEGVVVPTSRMIKLMLSRDLAVERGDPSRPAYFDPAGGIWPGVMQKGLMAAPRDYDDMMRAARMLAQLTGRPGRVLPLSRWNPEEIAGKSNAHYRPAIVIAKSESELQLLRDNSTKEFDYQKYNLVAGRPYEVNGVRSDRRGVGVKFELINPNPGVEKDPKPIPAELFDRFFQDHLITND